MRQSILFLLLFTPVIALAQPDTLWTRTYGGSGDEYTSGLIALDRGGYVISATTNSFGSGGMDFYLVRVNGNGSPAWTQTYGEGTGDDWCTGLVQLEGGPLNGNILAAGYGVRAGGPEQAVRVAYFDTLSGYQGYFDMYSTGWDTHIYSVCANTASRAAIAGCLSNATGQGRLAVYQSIGGPPFLGSEVEYGYYSCARSIKPTTDGGYIVAGSTKATQNANSDYLLVRLGAFADTLWTRTFGGTGEDLAVSVVQTHDSGFAMTGPSDSYGVNGDVVLLKTDSAGNQQWLHTFGGDGEEHGHVVLATQDGGYFLAGHTTSFGQNGDVYVMRTDSAGNLLWSRHWGGAGLDVAEAAVELADGGFLVAGETTSFGAGSSDIWVLRIAPELPSSERALIPDGFSLAQNYPNPFNSSTRISFYVPRSGPVTLRVFDLLGKTTATLLAGIQTAGQHEVLLDASSFPSGIYFYRLDARGWSDTRKMILLK